MNVDPAQASTAGIERQAPEKKVGCRASSAQCRFGKYPNGGNCRDTKCSRSTLNLGT